MFLPRCRTLPLLNPIRFLSAQIKVVALGMAATHPYWVAVGNAIAKAAGAVVLGSKRGEKKSLKEMRFNILRLKFRSG